MVILIVDDHLDTCRPLVTLLRMEGIDAECYDDPRAALAAIETLHPELLVLDQMMPGLSGLDLLHAIRSMPTLAAIPAIFYTATEDGQAEARRLGALDWVLKGKTDWADLRRRIVDLYHARKALAGEQPRPARE